MRSYKIQLQNTKRVQWARSFSPTLCDSSLSFNSFNTLKPRLHQQQRRSNARLCRKNRSTCSIRLCCFDIFAGVDGALNIETGHTSLPATMNITYRISSNRSRVSNTSRVSNNRSRGLKANIIELIAHTHPPTSSTVVHCVIRAYCEINRTAVWLTGYFALQ